MSMGMVLRLTAVLLISVPAALAAAPVRSPMVELYARDHWGEDQGVPSIPVTAVARTRDGFLWVGSRRGLSRFDGSRFVPVASADGHVPNIFALLETRDGVLWAGEFDGLSRLRDGVLERVSAFHEAVRTLAEGRDGALYLALDSGTVVMRGDRTETLGKCRGPAVALAEDAAGVLWAGNSIGTCRLTGSHFEHIEPRQGGAGENVRDILRDSRNRLWVASRNGLYRQRAPGGPLTLLRDAGLVSANVHTIAEDDQGHLWAATTAGGVQRLDPATERFHEVVAPESTIVTMLTDADGSIWLGTASGLERLRPRPFQTLTRAEGISSTVVWSVAADPGSNRVWVGGDGGLDLVDGDHAVPMGNRWGLEGETVSTTLRARDGSLWVSTRRDVLRIVGDKATPVLGPGGRHLDVVRAIFQARDDSIWIATTEGLLHLQGDKATTLPLPAVRPIRVIQQDEAGDLLVAGGRLRRLEAPSWAEVAIGGDELGSNVTALAQDGRDLWICSYDRGLLVLHGGKIISLANLDTRFLRPYVGVQLDDQGRLWLSSEGGLQVAAKHDLLDLAEGRTGGIAVRAYDEREGLLSSEFNNAGQTSSLRTSDDRKWFPSVVGVVVVDPLTLRTPASAAPPRVERVLVDGRDISWKGGEIEIARRHSSLDIQYAAPSLLHAHRLEFRHRLQGRDAGWVRAGPRRDAVYGDLDPGDYLLELEASTDGGHWTPAVSSLRVRVRPGPFETTTSRILLVVAVLGAAALVTAGMSRLRAQRLRARAQELEHLVDQRTHELAAARDELELRVQQRTAELQHQLGERERLEGQLLESQKLDSLGRLAGGVAHDLNNLLTVVLGYSSPAQLARAASPERLREDLSEIHRAGERAAALTRQLLAFARRQVLESELLDLNVVLFDFVKLIRRLIGENIEIVTLPSASVCLVLGDAGQMGQVLVNLAVNARDAMPQGGKLVLETALVRLGAVEAAPLGLAAGEYVTLAVRDDGVGMDERTKEHLFEPFFTTKAKGKGTGLGLATSYGIIKQMGGHITADSAPGRGTTMTIYLPRAEGQPAVHEIAAEVGAPGGNETVLLVEDEPLVLGLAVRTLRERGYRVITATNGVEALRVAAENVGPLDLLLADVVMPLMGGFELYANLSHLRPRLPVVFMSGYVDTSLPGAASLPSGVRLLHKPFTPAELARRVREALDAKATSAA
jgi:signal transduction histidine kinase/ligand-binding sensor domain-containing protein/CheY-like chemotaxis protein